MNEKICAHVNFTQRQYELHIWFGGFHFSYVQNYDLRFMNLFTHQHISDDFKVICEVGNQKATKFIAEKKSICVGSRFLIAAIKIK